MKKILCLLYLIYAVSVCSDSFNDINFPNKVKKVLLFNDIKYKVFSDYNLNDKKKEYSFSEIESSKNAQPFIDAVSDSDFSGHDEYLANARRIEQENDTEILSRISRRLSEGEDRSENIFALRIPLRQYRGVSLVSRTTTARTDISNDTATLHDFEIKGSANLVSLHQNVSAHFYNSPADISGGLEISVFSPADRLIRFHTNLEYNTAMDDSFNAIDNGGRMRSISLRADTRKGIFDFYADILRGFYYSDELNSRIGGKTEWGAGISVSISEFPEKYFPLGFFRRNTDENIGIPFYLRFLAGFRRQKANFSDTTVIQVIEQSRETRYSFDVSFPLQKKGGITANVYTGVNPDRDFAFGKLYGCSVRFHYVIIPRLYVTGEYAVDSESQEAAVNGRSRTINLGLNKSF